MALLKPIGIEIRSEIHCALPYVMVLPRSHPRKRLGSTNQPDHLAACAIMHSTAVSTQTRVWCCYFQK